MPTGQATGLGKEHLLGAYCIPSSGQWVWLSAGDTILFPLFCVR